MGLIEWITVIVVVPSVLAAALALLLGRAASDSHKQMPHPPRWQPEREER